MSGERECGERRDGGRIEKRNEKWQENRRNGWKEERQECRERERERERIGYIWPVKPDF